MTGSPVQPAATSAREELAADRRTERRIAWRGLLAVALVAAFIVVRALWLT